MEIIAHRGACFDAPENSLEAFERALAQGAERIELDVHLTADGVPIVCHDESTGRTTGVDLPVAGTDLDVLRGLRLANGELLPTLAEAADLVRGRGTLDVEIKAGSAAAVRAVLEVLHATGASTDVLITSFDQGVIAATRAAGHRGRLGLLIGSRSLQPRQRAYETWPLRALRGLGADTLVIHHRLLHPLLRRALRARAIGCVLWTATEDEEKPPDVRARMLRRAAALRPDGLIVGRVAEARSVLGLGPASY